MLKRKKIKKYEYLFALFCVFHFLLTPLTIAIFNANPAYVIVVNYSIVIISSSILARQRTSKIITYIIGLITLIIIWTELHNEHSRVIEGLRLLFSIRFILGPILGFLYLGILGGILFETVHFFDKYAFNIAEGFSGFSFYYFSFISITTVGYGDITPLSAPTQAITLVMNIIGQFYLAIVIGVFVGKYINVKSK